MDSSIEASEAQTGSEPRLVVCRVRGRDTQILGLSCFLDRGKKRYEFVKRKVKIGS